MQKNTPEDEIRKGNVEFSRQLEILFEVSLELTRTNSFDDLCRRSVEQIKEKLGLDRVGIWFVDENNPDFEIGSFGTDEDGKIRDERGERHQIRKYPGITELLENKIRQVYQEKTDLANPLNTVVGKGEHVVTGIWDGYKVIGFLNTDNLMTAKPITESSRELLKLYANTLGHLCTQKKVEDALKYKSKFEKLISEISTTFINLPIDSIDKHIESALKDICLFTGADGGYIYSFNENLTKLKTTHFWKKDEFHINRNTGAELDMTQLKWWSDQILSKKVLEIPSIDSIPEYAELERDLVVLSGAASSIDLTMVYQDKIIGAMSFSSAEQKRFWTKDEISLLQLLGQSIMNALQRKGAEEESRKLRNQLSQAQKMEAIGQLAGGIAHDFNNLLQVIQGYTNLSLGEIQPDNGITENLIEVMKAVDKASGLVQQLLTFSRRKILNSAYLNLNDVIAGLMKMVSRVIGEDIELNVIPGHDLGTIFADHGQIEQVLINLCVNARDAMPDGGKITIETGNVYFSSTFCSNNPWAKEGKYVSLEIADTGLGMSTEIREHIFEPFFTTKEVGEGTGLGLATVYGVIKQHDGAINIISEPEMGTKFQLFFPASIEKPSSITEKVSGIIETRGDETILLAEDDEQVRNIMVRVLERAGYRVLLARDGEEAINVFYNNGEDVSLAILDVVMPKKNGKAVLESIRNFNSNIPVIFCTGYSRDYLGSKYEPEDNTDLIQKPISPDELIKKIKYLLN